MAYLQQDDKHLIEDLLTRKEFYWLKRWDHDSDKSNKAKFLKSIIPRFMLENSISKGNYLKLLGHQMFVENFMNPNTEYKRLHVKWSTGSGKTIGGLSIAMNFIEHFRLEKEMGHIEIGSVFIIGFSERAFKNELLRYPEFGFLSKDERIKRDKLKSLAARGSKVDIDNYQEMTTKIKKRFSNRKGNGFFRFYGYKAFVNRIFAAPAEININEMTEEQIRVALSDGRIAYNEPLLAEFKNSIIICDEIHNVYNSAEKNNWGIAIQAVLDKEPTVRCVTLSATPLNNNPAEIVDLLNLLLPVERRVSREDFFVNDRDLKPGALEKIADLSRGRFSFLIDVNPKFYPKMITSGDSLREIPYLKFIRCPMSPFHYKTYKEVYTGALSQDSQYLVDFALENPETKNGIGIFQTQQIKKLIPDASQKWKDKYKLDYKDGKIVGNALMYDNLKKYSSKYTKMLDEIMSAIKNDQGQIFIYHNVVHMSGVLFIEQVLLRNGFLDEFSSSSDNTICMRCGKIRKEHSKDEIMTSITGSFEHVKKLEKNSDVIDDILDDKLAQINESLKTTNVKSKVFDDEPDDSYHSDNDESSTDNDDELDESDDYSDYDYDELDESDYDYDDYSDNKDKNIIIPVDLSKSLVKSLDIGEQHICNVYMKDKKYWIPVVENSLLSADDKILDVFMKFIDDYKDLPLVIKISNGLGKKLGEYLLNNEFDLLQHNSNYSYLIRPTTKKLIEALPKRHIGGAVKKHNTKHKFTPARFIMAHSDIDKAVMEHSLEKFNSPDNLDGSKYLILVGSKIIKESYDLKAIQNVFIMGKPDNIPMLIQIRGRAVRKNSHRGLPPEKQVVRVKLFTSCLPVKQETGLDKGSYKLSYEEEKYKEKIYAFQVIQKIEKVIHENSIDALINHERIQRHASEDPLGPLSYTPKIAHKFDREFDVSELNLSTFNIFHAHKEVEICKTLIKRLFIEMSSVWDYKDLFAAVQNPPADYENEINTRLFTEDHFLIALDQLTWVNSKSHVEPFISKDTVGGNAVTEGDTVGGEENTNNSRFESKSPSVLEDLQLGTNSRVHRQRIGGRISSTCRECFTKVNPVDNITGGSDTNTNHFQALHLAHANHPSYIIDHLYDTNDKIITLPGGQDNIIVPIFDGSKQFYILFPINYTTNAPDIDIELPYRIVKQENQIKININSFIQTKRIDFDYDDKKRIFFRKYADIAIENMENVVCEYGTTFHIKFIEECIEYVFNAWTSPTVLKSEYHEFYFKMLYYYDLLSLVMWAHTTKQRIFKDYAKYAIPVRAKDIKLKILNRYENRPDEIADISPPDNSDLATSGVINLLKSTYNRTSNAWIPAEFREQFDTTINKSLELYAGKKKKSKSVSKVMADLLPIGHYISKFPRLYHPEREWSEDPTYLQNEQEFKENNLIIGFDERSVTGVHIRFKIRNPIHNIKKHKDSRLIEHGTVCKSKSKEYLQGIARKLDVMLPEKFNVEELCSLIRSKLVRLELLERIRKSNIKFFYSSYENRPGLR